MSSKSFSLSEARLANSPLLLTSQFKSTSFSNSSIAASLSCSLVNSYSALSFLLAVSSSSDLISFVIAVESEIQNIFFSNNLNNSLFDLSKGKGSSNSLSTFIRLLFSSNVNPLLSKKSNKLELPVFAYFSPLITYSGDLEVRDHSIELP